MAAVAMVLPVSIIADVVKAVWADVNLFFSVGVTV